VRSEPGWWPAHVGLVGRAEVALIETLTVEHLRGAAPAGLSAERLADLTGMRLWRVRRALRKLRERNRVVLDRRPVPWHPHGARVRGYLLAEHHLQLAELAPIIAPDRITGPIGMRPLARRADGWPFPRE
jgi:hypothetical protein